MAYFGSILHLFDYKNVLQFIFIFVKDFKSYSSFVNYLKYVQQIWCLRNVESPNPRQNRSQENITIIPIEMYLEK